jgi:hypothetical protein
MSDKTKSVLSTAILLQIPLLLAAWGGAAAFSPVDPPINWHDTSMFLAGVVLFFFCGITGVAATLAIGFLSPDIPPEADAQAVREEGKP